MGAVADGRSAGKDLSCSSPPTEEDQGPVWESWCHYSLRQTLNGKTLLSSSHLFSFDLCACVSFCIRVSHTERTHTVSEVVVTFVYGKNASI